MNSIFRKLFGTSSDEAKNDKQNEVKSPYTPNISLPIDEQFTMNFINNGGKFIYCENLKEVSDNFENILAENDWYEKEALCFDPRLFKFLPKRRCINC